MAAEPRLQLDDWIYTIGARGGLYHQRPDSKEPPKRIHFSHPPVHHRDAVKAWQDLYLKQNNLYLSKRDQVPKPIPQSLIVTEEKTEKPVATKEEKQESKQEQVTPQEVISKPKSLKKQQDAKKVTKKKKGSKVKKELVSSAVFGASSLESAQKICREVETVCAGQILPWISEKYFSHYPELSQTVEIYYLKNSMDAKLARKFLQERLLLPAESALWSTTTEYMTQQFGVSDAWYDLQLDKSVGLLGFYCDAFCKMDDGSVQKWNTLQIAEPSSGHSKKLYSDLFGYIRHCSSQSGSSDGCVLFDWKSVRYAKPIVLEALRELGETLRGVDLLIVNYDEMCSLPTVNSLQAARKWLQDKQEKQDKQDKREVLWCGFCDPSYVIGPPLFGIHSTSVLTTSCLTNSHLQSDDVLIGI